LLQTRYGWQQSVAVQDTQLQQQSRRISEEGSTIAGENWLVPECLGLIGKKNSPIKGECCDFQPTEKI